MSPLRIVLALLLIVLAVEIYLFIKIGGLIGVLPTLLLVVFSAVIGVALLRQQGFATLMRLQASLARGEIPAIEMLEGALLLIGGVLLLTPGFFTDVIGFLCLIPALRRRVVLWAIRRGVVASAGPGASSPLHGHGPRTLEGEFWKDDERR